MFPFVKIKNRQTFPYARITKFTRQQVAASFIEAVKAKSDDAWQFVSKVYAPGLDMKELQDILATNTVKRITRASYTNDTRQSSTRSVYVEDPTRNIKRIIHLRMIKEADHNGQWKIFGVEQEECIKRL